MKKMPSGKKGLSNPPKQAMSFPEKEYTESVKDGPPSSEYAKGGSEETGPNNPGYGGR